MRGAVEVLLHKRLPVHSSVLKFVQLEAVGNRWLLCIVLGLWRVKLSLYVMFLLAALKSRELS